MPTTEVSARVLELLRGRMSDPPLQVQRERQVAYVLMISTLLADGDHQIEAGEPTPIDARELRTTSST